MPISKHSLNVQVNQEKFFHLNLLPFKMSKEAVHNSLNSEEIKIGKLRQNFLLKVVNKTNSF